MSAAQMTAASIVFIVLAALAAFVLVSVIIGLLARATKRKKDKK